MTNSIHEKLAQLRRNLAQLEEASQKYPELFQWANFVDLNGEQPELHVYSYDGAEEHAKRLEAASNHRQANWKRQQTAGHTYHWVGEIAGVKLQWDNMERIPQAAQDWIPVFPS